MARCMAELVKRSTVPIDRFEIRLRRRDLYVVLRGDVECAPAADAEVDPGGLDQCLDGRFDKAGLRRRSCDGNLLGQALAAGLGESHRRDLDDAARQTAANASKRYVPLTSLVVPNICSP